MVVRNEYPLETMRIIRCGSTGSPCPYVTQPLAHPPFIGNTRKPSLHRLHETKATIAAQSLQAEKIEPPQWLCKALAEAILAYKLRIRRSSHQHGRRHILPLKSSQPD
jgi:hypothetical protein